MQEPSANTLTADVAVVGAGIVGLASARELLLRRPDARVVVIEKEDGPARHQSGHNTGTIHSGIYYQPGSEKARLCVEGRRLMVAYCTERGIPFDMCGKLIVATTREEDARLEALRERGIRNGLSGVTMLTAAELRELEPNVRGIRALLVPEAGTTNYRLVADAIAREVQQRGGTIEYGARVEAIRQSAGGVDLATTRRTIHAKSAIACAGLHSDRVAALAGVATRTRIVPFRGDYYRVRRERLPLVRRLVYNVPDPRLPFLGVHIARQLDGEVLLGPNAVLAFAREGYRRRDVDVRDLLATFRDRGFQRLVSRHWRSGAFELARDLYKPLFLASVRRYVPGLRLRDLLPGPSGVRAQALDRDGNLVDDFVFDVVGRFLNVRNAPSPAATSSLALARVLVDRLPA